MCLHIAYFEGGMLLLDTGRATDPLLPHVYALLYEETKDENDMEADATQLTLRTVRASHIARPTAL